MTTRSSAALELFSGYKPDDWEARNTVNADCFVRPDEISGIYPAAMGEEPDRPYTNIGLKAECVEFNTELLPAEVLSLMPLSFCKIRRQMMLGDFYTFYTCEDRARRLFASQIVARTMPALKPDFK